MRQQLTWVKTYSSRMKLPTEMPPQLIPFIWLPAMLSRRARLPSRLGFAVEIGRGPALTNESWRLRPSALMAASKPLAMSTSEGLLRSSQSEKREVSWASMTRADEGRDSGNDCRAGVAMAIGFEAALVPSSMNRLRPRAGELGVAGCSGDGDNDGDADGSCDAGDADRKAARALSNAKNVVVPAGGSEGLERFEWDVDEILG
jgi:hypothetical protein